MRALAAALMIVAATTFVTAEDWPHWRGPALNGVSTETDLPTKWSKTENIDWMVPVPSWGGSTPIIWGNRVFLQVTDGADVVLWAIDRNTHAIVWKHTFAEAGDKLVLKEGLAHQTAATKQNENYSSPSPVTDGTNVWAVTGKGIVKAFDFSGKVVWTREIQKDYGRFGLNYGYHSSPVLYGDSLYLQVVHGSTTEDPSYLLRLDKLTGRTIWKVERTREASAKIESADSYRSPVLLRQGNEVQLIVAGGDALTAHDLATGKEIWRGTGFNPSNSAILNTVASPVVADGVIYAPGKERLGPLVAYKGGGQGNVTETHRLWTSTSGSLTPTPVSDGKYLYSLNDRGIVFCFDAKTGAVVYGPERIANGSYSSSAVLADGKLYLTSEEGTTTVVKAGPQFEILSTNMLEGYTLSSMAISQGQLFLRTAEALWVIGKRKP